MDNGKQESAADKLPFGGASHCRAKLHVKRRDVICISFSGGYEIALTAQGVAWRRRWFGERPFDCVALDKLSARVTRTRSGLIPRFHLEVFERYDGALLVSFVAQHPDRWIRALQQRGVDVDDPWRVGRRPIYGFLVNSLDTVMSFRLIIVVFIVFIVETRGDTISAAVILAIIAACMAHWLIMVD